MTQDEIEEEVRRALFEPHAQRVSSANITTATLDAVGILGATLLGESPESFVTRKSLQSLNSAGPVFTLPSDCHSLLKVWDMGDNALSVSATADDGAGLVEVTTSAAHSLSTDDLVTIHDIVGTTEANGTWMITVTSTTKFTLQGSTFTNAWVSGGKVIVESDDFSIIRREPSQDMMTDDETHYYLRAGNIIVDDNTFDNDLIVQYVSFPDALADIPTRFHFGLPGYCVMKLTKLVPMDDPLFVAIQTSIKINQGIWQTCLEMAKAFRPASESINISESKKVRRWI